MEFNVEELKSALIEKCKSEGILYAMVAVDRRTKEIILPDTLQGALKHPEYFVKACIYEKTSARRNGRFASFLLVANGAGDTGRSDYGI